MLFLLIVASNLKLAVRMKITAIGNLNALSIITVLLEKKAAGSPLLATPLGGYHYWLKTSS